jgi:hypothetical protein
MNLTDNEIRVAMRKLSLPCGTIPHFDQPKTQLLVACDRLDSSLEQLKLSLGVDTRGIIHADHHPDPQHVAAKLTELHYQLYRLYGELGMMELPLDLLLQRLSAHVIPE